MLSALINAFIRLIEGFRNPFFLIPAVLSFMRSILALILFGLIVQLIALLPADAYFQSVLAFYAFGSILRIL